MKVIIEISDDAVHVQSPNENETLVYLATDLQPEDLDVIKFLLSQISGDAPYLSDKTIGIAMLKRASKEFGRDVVYEAYRALGLEMGTDY